MAHLHLLGIAGAFMAGIARLALELGHQVSGSDRAFYPPFGSEVKRLNIPLFESYDSDCRRRPADLYIIGNAISRGNPLLESLLRERRPFISAPQWLYENVLRRRRVLAVAGTHGKTTTATLLAHILERSGQAPGFLIGGVAPGFGVSARLSAASPLFVIEADEYDSAYFDKRPKFLHYHPHAAVINNIEFDHADIYPDLAAIIRQFHYLFRAVPASGVILARAGDANIQQAIAQGCYSPLQYFGDAEQGKDNGAAAAVGEPQSARWRAVFNNGAMQILHNGAPLGAPFTPPLPGAANRDNILAAVAAAAAAGADAARAGEYLRDCQPPLRRLQRLGDIRLAVGSGGGSIRLYDDFAHHPTAIAKTIAALAEQRAAEGRGGRLIAVFEPRSNTMKAGVFQRQWRDTFSQADIIIAVGEHPWLSDTLTACVSPLHIVPRATAAAQLLHTLAAPGDDILLMSNGDFGGLARLLSEADG